MAVVDSLEAIIESKVVDTNKGFEKLIKNLDIVADKISVIKVNKSFQQLSNTAKNISENVSNMGAKMPQSMKPMQEQAEKVAKTLEQITAKYKDLGKEFKYAGNEVATQRQIDKYSNSLENAKLKKQELEAAGKTEGKGYEDAVRSVLKYTNVIENLKNQLSSLKTEQPKLQLEGLNDAQFKDFLNTLPTFREQAEEAANATKDIGTSAVESAREYIGAWNGIKIPKELLTSANELSREVNKNAKYIDDVENKIGELGQKFKDVGTDFVFKGNSEQLTKEINKVLSQLDKLYEKQDKMISLGKIDTAGFESLQYDITKTSNKLEILQNTVAETEENVNKSSYKLSSFGSVIKKAFSGVIKILKEVNRAINGVLSKIGKLIKSMFSLGNSAKSTNKGFNLNLKTVLKYGLGIRSLYVLFNKLRSAIKEGMKNLVQYSEETNESISLLNNSLATLKNASAAAISPLLNAIAPALNQIIQLVIKATNYINQLISTLMGKTTWIRAKELTDSWADSIKKAGKAANAAIRPFDELKVISMSSGGGAGEETAAEDMFETLPIESKFEQLADKIKDIADQIFTPFRTAWENQGQFVMDSWKYALEEIGALSKVVGKDFLSVWNQPETISILDNILVIIGDIGIAVGKLADNFRKAWSEGETGKTILQNIRDIFGIIVDNVKNAANYTIEWVANIDFSPLLESFKNWSESLKPAIDGISGILLDFYEQVLLPLGKWTLEKGLPELLDVFTEFNEKVDWPALRENLSEFWSHLEPFTETVGEGLVLFIDRVSDSLADFLNSQEFKDFLADVEKWMDKVTPEDVADGLEKVAKGIIALNVGLAAWEFLETPLGIFISFIELASSIKMTQALKNLASGAGAASAGTSLFGGLFSAFSSLGGIGGILTTDLATIIGAGTATEIGLTIGIAIIAGIAAAIAGFNFGKWLGENLFPEDAEYYENFKFFGEGGFFDTLTSDWETSLEALEKMFTDFENNPAVAGLMNIIFPQAGAIANAKSNFEEIKTNFSNLTNWVSETGKSVKSTFSETWESVRTKTKETWDKILGLFNKDGKIFDGITGSIGKIFTTIINALIDGINKVVSVPFKSINKSLEDLKSVEIFGIKPFDWITTIDIPQFPKVQFAQYAAGGFPEDGWFRASHGEIMGKFDNGQSVVANNMQITEGIADAVRTAFYDAMSAAIKNNKSSTSPEIRVFIGDREITDVAIQGITERANRTKKMPFPVYLG